jgi:hypothetical protein
MAVGTSSDGLQGRAAAPTELLALGVLLLAMTALHRLLHIRRARLRFADDNARAAEGQSQDPSQETVGLPLVGAACFRVTFLGTKQRPNPRSLE